MGLPMWRAPSEEARDARKADLTAPARSPIRRRSPSGRRARPAPSPRSPRLRGHDLVRSASLVAHAEPITRPPSGRPRLPPPPVPESRNYARHGSGDPASARDSAGWLGMVDNDAIAARARRERYYRATVDSTLSLRRDVSSRQLPAFTPNFAPAAASRLSPTETAILQTEAAIAQTEAAISQSEAALAQSDTAFQRLRSNHTSRASPRASSHRRGNDLHDNFLIIEDGDDDSSDHNAVGFPPLRRMGRRTIADGPLPSSSLRESWSPATTLDGLGDRERSISPVADDHWETMLSNIAPDPLAPTADSSFTSAAASASFSNSHPSSRAGSSNSNSASSSRTHLTVPSRRHSPQNELFMRACDTSDSDTASDTEEEDMHVRPDRLSSYSSLRPRAAPLLTEPESLLDPPSRDPARYSRGIRNRSRDVSAYVRNFYGTRSREHSQQPQRPHIDQLDGPAEEPINVEDELETLDQELRDARAILARLSRRENVPDDFWASVGLARTAADRVERFQQRERL